MDSEVQNSAKWQRPVSVPIPQVYAIYESKKPMANGRTPRFRIQDCTEDLEESVIHNMMTFFLKDEPLSRCLGLTHHESSRKEFGKLFSEVLKGRMVLVAVVENLDELGDPSLPLLAGCNMTVVKRDDEKIEGAMSDKLQLIFDALTKLEENVDYYKRYNVTECLYAFGLSVDPVFRGHGLGYEILKARFPMCKKFGIKATVTVFTSGAAQKSASKAGFELLSELAYADYKDANGKVIFPIDDPKSMKLMGVAID